MTPRDSMLTVAEDPYVKEYPCITWKDEDEVDGVAIGPAFYWPSAESRVKLPAEPWGEGVIDFGWIPKATAMRLATAKNVPFFEF